MGRQLLIQTIFTRRSIRKYTADPVGEEDVNALLEAAMSAPSAGNSQPWHFVVVTDRQTLDALAQVHAYGKMLFEAPVCIAVCGDPSLSRHHWVQDCSAATEDLLLAAAAPGLGAVMAMNAQEAAEMIETRAEIDRLFELVDLDVVFQGPDIGHLAWAGADAVQFCRDYADCIVSMHVKDIDPDMLKEGVAQSWDYGTFSRHGIFAELGEGLVDLPRAMLKRDVACLQTGG